MVTIITSAEAAEFIVCHGINTTFIGHVCSVWLNTVHAETLGENHGPNSNLCEWGYHALLSIGSNKLHEI